MKVPNLDATQTPHTTLLIMAAGIGSRFGTGIKQLEAVDPQGHIIMDYSIHDAIEAGFDKILFVIRREIEEEFREAIGGRIGRVCAEHGVEVEYAFQDLREKVMGTFPTIHFFLQNREENSQIAENLRNPIKIVPNFPVFKM